MAAHVPIERKIQNDDVKRDRQDVSKGGPLGTWLTCRPRGPHQKASKRTSFVLFHMVAELAIAERFIGLASLLASIVVTRASQLLYYIAWLC
eukprot:2912240-Amphidinium_carterae.1